MNKTYNKRDEKTIRNERVREEYRVINHFSGLKIYLYPMRGYSGATAMFTARYGSIDLTFKTNRDKDFTTVPAGIAHYLEHKLFEGEECDAFEQFAKTGASCNAFTSFDKTTYYFSCSQKFEENLEILLNFVQSPYFTDENVEKERGIIAQELKMYLDEPRMALLCNCLKAVYHENPVRIDIGGTLDSIKEINKELLYKCYNTFYNLNNMTLVIVGSFDAEKALAVCDRLLRSSEDLGINVSLPDEPYEVREKEVTRKLSCSMPLFYIAFKQPSYESQEALQNYIRFNILLETVFGETSEFFGKMFDAGLINDEFRVSVFEERGFFVPMISGETSEPKKIFSEVKKLLHVIQADGVDGNEFEIVKRKTYGELLKVFNSVSSAALHLMDSSVRGGSMYDLLEETAKVTLSDINNVIKKLDIENSSLSVIEPV